MAWNWQDILNYAAYASPYYPLPTLWAHRDMMASIEPEEEQKLQRLRTTLDENADHLPKATFWTSGSGLICLGGVLFISTFFIQWVWGEVGSLRWNHWFSLVNGCVILACGVYATAYQETISRKRLEVEWVEKWKKGKFLERDARRDDD